MILNFIIVWKLFIVMKIYHVLKCSLSPRQAELAKKKICRIFQENGFRITAQANLKSVNFLDINLNLESGLFKPYMKPNDTPVYVHKDSNHPRSILDNILKSVNRRLSAIFSNQQVFEVACPPLPSCPSTQITKNCKILNA